MSQGAADWAVDSPEVAATRTLECCQSRNCDKTYKQLPQIQNDPRDAAEGAYTNKTVVSKQGATQHPRAHCRHEWCLPLKLMFRGAPSSSTANGVRVDLPCRGLVNGQPIE